VPQLHLDILTFERTVLSLDVDALVAMTEKGQISVLPGHSSLVTLLQAGELMVRIGAEDHYLAVSGGFLEVTSQGVVILADACERADEIDVQRAEEARRSAEELLGAAGREADSAVAEAALRRSLVRLKVVDRYRRRTRRRAFE
jgi:F-type H+-transporting ATPase subunit epsilon